MMYQGSCLCGAINVEVGQISAIIHCHCSLCRKSSGTAFATNGFVNSDEFKIVKGADNLNFFEMKTGRKRHFCQTCGSPVYSSNDADKSRIRLRLGILDSDISERPISHNFVTSKACWDSLNEDLPQYEAYEPNRQ